MAKKFNQSLLNEELKKFRMLSEYTFYTEEPESDNDLILGAGLSEVDEDPNNPAGAPDDSKTAMGASGATPDMGGQQAPPPASGAPVPGESPVTPQDTAPPAEAPAPSADDMGGIDDMGDDMSSGDEVEVDVTQLVQSGEDAKQSADAANQKSSALLNKFSDLERRVSSMDGLAHKIDTLEKEIIKRNPTPVEKLEMRSLDSYPFNIKLNDYWKDVDGYDTGQGSQPKEYVLTQDDVDSGFTDSSIKDSFNVPEDYEEEDIDY
jgi:hypothetical protein